MKGALAAVLILLALVGCTSPGAAPGPLSAPYPQDDRGSAPEHGGGDGGGGGGGSGSGSGSGM